MTKDESSSVAAHTLGRILLLCGRCCPCNGLVTTGHTRTERKQPFEDRAALLDRLCAFVPRVSALALVCSAGATMATVLEACSL